MQSLLLHNFKSYEQQSLNNINSRINIVLGSNGQGKSNFFKAISFLFTDKYTLNRAEFNGTLHRGAHATKPELLVQATFSNNQQESKIYKLSKSWNNNMIEDFKINDKSRTKAEFENFIESFGLTYTSPYNIVQQGKIAQISQMNENELYLLLQDTAGVKRFMKKSEEARNNLSKIQNDLTEAEQNLKFLKDKVSHIEDRKNEFELFVVEEKIRKIKKKRELINSIANADNNIKQMKAKHLQILKELQQNKMKQTNLNQEIDDRQHRLKILTQKSYFYQKENSEIVEETNTLAKKTKPLSAKKKDLKELEKKIASEQKVLQQNQNKLNSLEKQFNSYREKYEIIKTDYELQGESKDQMKIKQAYQSKIQAENETIKNTQQELKKLAKIREDYKLVNYTSEAKQLQSLQNELAPILEQLKKLRIHLIELARNKMNTECQIQTILAKRKHQDDIVKKIMPMVDLRLKQLLEENKVEGVYGYLIEHVKIEKDVAFAYELAGLTRLCTLLVQNDQVAAKVIEINKKIQGRNINILPLSYIKTQALEKRAYPRAQNVFSLINEDWIKVTNSQKFASDTKSVIQKVVNNTFARHALVEDYTTALKVSKQFNLNCITADREIVYADAYMCKVGREETYDKGKIEHFESLQSLSQEFLSKKVSLSLIQKKEVELQNQEIQLSNKQEKFDLKINQLQKTIDQAKKIESLINKVQAKRASLQESIQRSNRAIQQYETSIKNLQNNNKSKFRPEDFQKAEAQYFAHKTKVQKLFEENYERQKAISSMFKELQIIKKEISNMEKKDPSLPELESKEQILKDLDDMRRKYEDQIGNLSKELGHTIEKRSDIKQKQVEMLAQINFEQENQKENKAKLSTMADINPEEQEEIEELSHSLSRRLNPDDLANRKRHLYTARDKVFFSKIMGYVDKVNYFNEATKDISKQRQKLLEYVEDTEREASKHMKNFVVNFEKQFIHYFLRFVPNGKAELKTRIYTQKVKGITKNGYSLEIKVCFNEDEGTRKWSEFSGGQKTVLSLCIILAIQKCQPAPFCVFDEVDAALDPFYSKKLVEIITEQSKHCQYFITSFKKSMLDFPEEIANYYLVKTVDRVSNITLVEKEEAEGFIEKFAE